MMLCEHAMRGDTDGKLRAIGSGSRSQPSVRSATARLHGSGGETSRTHRPTNTHTAWRHNYHLLPRVLRRQRVQTCLL